MKGSRFDDARDSANAVATPPFGAIEPNRAIGVTSAARKEQGQDAPNAHDNDRAA
jgi:hypothetical protein